uniref:Uncharacterized protein n=1 Tax=Heterorhabditis bacteriophora TaxID=37862 RepID=A0A1I7X7Z0_HETBA
MTEVKLILYKKSERGKKRRYRRKKEPSGDNKQEQIIEAPTPKNTDSNSGVNKALPPVLTTKINDNIAPEIKKQIE